MVARESRQFLPAAIALFAVAIPATIAAQQSDSNGRLRPVEPQAASDSYDSASLRQLPPERWPRVHLSDPVALHAARNALDTAAAWLHKPACEKLFADFSDQEKRPLTDRLTKLGLDVQSYLELVVFIDESPRACVEGALAHAVPGSRLVRLCPEALKHMWQQNPAYTAAMFIHELLHTIGAGENPPSSDDITRRVLARCR